jgi:signal transduction histidine kinase
MAIIPPKMNPTAPHHRTRILHLEDSALDHELVQLNLRKSGLTFEIVRVETLDDFVHALGSAVFDAVVADYRLPGFTAIDAWLSLPPHALRPPFILLSGAIGEAAAVEAIQLGMSDYLLKDDMGRLAHVIDRAIEVQESRLARERAAFELAASEERMAKFAEHLQTAIEQERAAIAREIHDDIGGSLAAIQFDLSWLGRHVADPAALTHLQAASDMLQHAIGASQRIMMNLRPAILDQGLEAALQWLTQSFEKRTGIKTALRTSRRAPALSKSVELTTYRTAQEALTNIAKHAQCSQVLVELSDAEDVLTLEVTDNGQGISGAELAKPESFGLKGLRERARTANGWLDISTRSGQGTSIILSIPLPRASAVPLQNT